MAQTDPPVDPAQEQPRPGRPIDDATRQRLLELLRRELTQASGDAVARGVPAERLAAQLDERAARLRAQLDRSTSQPPSEESADGTDDPA